MSGGTVLILTDHDDHTTDLIVHALHQRDATVVRLDPGTARLRMDARLDGARWRGLVGDEHRAARLEEVTGVLWRWPGAASGHPDIGDPAARAWAAREDALALHGVLSTLPVRWVNHPFAAAAAGHKPGQLLAARGCGLEVPDTLITTSGAGVADWAGGRPVLYKAAHAQGADEDAMVTAGAVDPAALPDHLGAASCFQPVVAGPSVRLTVVGNRMFAVRITGCPADLIDWRPIQDQLAFIPVPVPEHIAAGVHAFMRHFGLEYGAFDFIDSSGGWVFLEINPTGMYGFVEIQSGLAITDAITERLLTPLSGNEALASLGIVHGR
ncbi:MvdC/MvdD family ATP grasp protein [Actinomadura rugatobispora]|uniref:MvdC/MvdD family ATP grasp protein n=1 Tax=Actinomadura rugatobispora TaxID=1994 RepID=A0ABW0ZSF2_9ACTN|nr:ATP-grasp ribosomal peptide maturase [Actinomadura rugatobispora]